MGDSDSASDISYNGTTRSMADRISLHDFRIWIDVAVHLCRYESFHSSLSSYLELCGVFSPEDRAECLLKLLSEMEIELEEREVRNREAAFVCSEHFKRGYETAIAHLSEYYGLEIKVDSSTRALTTESPCLVDEPPPYQSKVGSQMPTSPIEEEVLVGEQLPSRRENVVEIFANKEADAEKGGGHYDITNESHKGSPLPANLLELCVCALQDPFADHLEAYKGSCFSGFFKIGRMPLFLSKTLPKGCKSQ